MRIGLPYGKEQQVFVEVPDDNFFYFTSRHKAPASTNPIKKLQRALRDPIGTPPLSQLVKAGDKVVILGDDITRPTPQDVIIPVLLDELNTIGIPDENIEVIIATGSHREMSDEETRDKYGRETKERVSVSNHDYKNPEKLVNLGRTESGIPVSLSKTVWTADTVIGVGNIVPHCYAGWGGGGKIIQPGVCGEETTSITHYLAGRRRPVNKLVGNLEQKIKREIDVVARKSNLRLIINTVLNHEDEIVSLVVGDMAKAFSIGVQIAEEIYCRPVPGHADIVFVSAYPADIEYWQSLKPLDYASIAVKQNGTIVLVSPCPDGISTTHPIFKEKASLTYHQIIAEVENCEINDRIAAGNLLLHSQALERAEVICYSHGLKEADKEALGFEHASTIEEATELAFKSQGRDAKIGFLECGDILPLMI